MSYEDLKARTVEAFANTAMETAEAITALEAERDGLREAAREAYGCLWRDVKASSMSRTARQLLFQVLEYDERKAGISYAIEKFGHVSDREIIDMEMSAETALNPEGGSDDKRLSQLVSRYGMSNGDFALVNGPYGKKQHQNEQRGLDVYVDLFNLRTGEFCVKKLYENSKGLHCKHTGFSPMYLADFTEPVEIFEFQYIPARQALGGTHDAS